MNEANASHPGTILLTGEWTVSGATDCHSFLLGQLAICPETVPVSLPVRIDLGGITGLDACGCQLLALFRAHLQQRGLSPQSFVAGPELCDQINLLGFGEELGLTSPGKEPHGD